MPPDTDYTALINHHLGDAYRVHVLGHAPDAAVRQLREHLEADSGLRIAAGKRLASLDNPSLLKRDFISRTHHQLLTAALAKGTT